VPLLLKLFVKVDGGLSTPEFQSSPNTGPGTQLTASHVPDVVECKGPCHTHSTVCPSVIVVVLVPLVSSTNAVPPWPTKTC
jgi:hypothetical protein